ncbi:hypothetical protein PanWU01x14_287340 [Parasponia andersonii]|uniref:Uncharacterized protein n=1 Tax=Parasponia andersonii TaxID=3476 RepID=A0A2P5AYX5_PARAD|nr:hypothetical protein PanWU01x14_287340 [Parasponia andersonii]
MAQEVVSRIRILEQEITELKNAKRRRENESESSKTPTGGDDDQDRTSSVGSQEVKEMELWLKLEEERRSLKEKIREYKKQEIELQKQTLTDMGSVELVSEKAEGGEEGTDYYGTLHEFLDPWKDISTEGREDGEKTLWEWIRQLDQSNEEERLVFDSMKSVAVDLGIELSQRIVWYFLQFTNTEPKEIKERTKKLEQTVRCVSLEEEDSIVTERFVSVIKSVDRGIRIPKQNLEEIKDKKRKRAADESASEVRYRERDDYIFGSIFSMVLFLEAAFCSPCFSVMLEKEDLMALGDFLRESFKEKMSKLNWDMKPECSKDQNVERNELKEMFDLKIKEIWNKFDSLPGAEQIGRKFSPRK